MKSKLWVILILSVALLMTVGVFLYLQKQKNDLTTAFYLESAEKMKRSSILQMRHDLSASQLLAISLSNNPLVKQTLLERSPEHTEEKLDILAKNINEYSRIGNVWIHIVSSDLYSIYRSWDEKRGDHLWFRKDLQLFLTDLRNHQGISVGKYNISYKNTVPVMDQGKFIGFVEAITFLPSTMENLLKDENIKSTVLIDKKNMKQLTDNVHNRFIGQHVVAFNNDAILLKHLNEAMLTDLIRSPYQVVDDRLVTVRVLDNLSGQPMGYILMALPQSVFEGKLRDTLEEINLLIIMSVVIFVFMLGFVLFYFRTINEEMRLVKVLNEELQERIDESVQKIKEQEFLIHEQSKNQAMTELLVNLAHHWRQPLNTAVLHIQRIDDIYEFEGGERSKIDEAVETAVSELETLSDSITDLTQVFEQGTDDYTTLRESLEVTRQFIEDTLRMHSIEVVSSIDQDVVLKATKVDMLEILSALFLNVRDVIMTRGHEGAEITVFQKVEGAGVVSIEILDNAGGIASDMLPDKIFEPFSTTQFKSRNKGVGLYRVKQLVVDHLGGEIQAENIDGGAKFTMRLPYE